MDFQVAYVIYSLIDMTEPVAAGSTIVTAENEKAAEALAIDWVYDNDPATDSRLDPSVRITGVEELDTEEV
jgi:hypothetical protein